MFKKVSVAVSAICATVLCCGFGLQVAEARTQDFQTVNITAEDFPRAFQNKEPVKIVDLYLGTTQVKSGEDFQADKDWLRDLRIMVKNVSDQSIREIILYLDLPTNDPNVGVRRVEIQYGRGYFTTRTPSTTVPDVLLRPGELATIYYDFNNPNAYANLTSHLSQDHHFSLPCKGTLFLGAVVFEDIEKGWYALKYVVRSGEGWMGDSSKPYSMLPRMQGHSGLSKGAFSIMKAAFATSKPLPLCYTFPGPPALLNDQIACTLCPTCKYNRPILETAEVGWNRYQGSATCYNTINGFINLDSPCSCCQGLVWQLNFSQACP